MPVRSAPQERVRLASSSVVIFGRHRRAASVTSLGHMTSSRDRSALRRAAGASRRPPRLPRRRTQRRKSTRKPSATTSSSGPRGRASSNGASRSRARSNGTSRSLAGLPTANSTCRSTVSTVTCAPAAATRSPIYYEGEPGDRWTITYARTARRRLPLRQRPAQARNRARRSRRDLHADDSRAAGRDARLRAHRRRAFGDLRRLLTRIDRRPRQRLAVRRADHRRLRLAARQEGSAQAQLRRGDGANAFDPALRRREPRRRRGVRCTRGATTGGTTSSPGSRRVRARGDERRRSALPSLHERHDGQAEGHQAHDGRLSHARR